MESEENGGKHDLVLDASLALVYAGLLIGCTVVVQSAVRGYLDQYEVYVGAFIVSLFAFFFSLILGAVGKAVINFAASDLYLSRNFVLFACLFAFIACAVCHSMLLVWWITAVMSAIGILVTFIKKLVMRKVKHKAEVVRDIEHDLRHESIDRARAVKDEVWDRFRGRR
jgi:predicted membrane protein